MDGHEQAELHREEAASRHLPHLQSVSSVSRFFSSKCARYCSKCAKKSASLKYQLFLLHFWTFQGGSTFSLYIYFLFFKKEIIFYYIKFFKKLKCATLREIQKSMRERGSKWATFRSTSPKCEHP